VATRGVDKTRRIKVAQAIVDRGKKEKGAGMTQDIIEMAKEAGFKMENSAAIQAAEIFHKLATAKEREACAKVCDALHKDWKWRAAESIRARGEQA